MPKDHPKTGAGAPLIPLAPRVYKDGKAQPGRRRARNFNELKAEIRAGSFELTDRERAALRGIAQQIQRTTPRFAALMAFVAALEKAGIVVDGDENVYELLERIEGLSEAEPLVLMFRAWTAAIDGDQAKRSGTNRKNASNPRRRGKSLTPEQAKAFMAEYLNRHGNSRGGKTAGAAHFEVDPETFAKRLKDGNNDLPD
jgi:hypothetical protein